MASLDLGANVEQPSDRLIVQNRQAVQSMRVEEVDGLDIGGQHGRRFVLPRHTYRPQKGHTTFVQTGAETSDTGAEAVQPDPRCSWKSHSRRVGFGDESTESRSVDLTLRIPSVIRPKRRISVDVVR